MLDFKEFCLKHLRDFILVVLFFFCLFVSVGSGLADVLVVDGGGGGGISVGSGLEDLRINHGVGGGVVLTGGFSVPVVGGLFEWWWLIVFVLVIVLVWWVVLVSRKKTRHD